MHKDWDYAKLAHYAKMFGGPTKFITGILAAGAVAGIGVMKGAEKIDEWYKAPKIAHNCTVACMPGSINPGKEFNWNNRTNTIALKFKKNEAVYKVAECDCFILIRKNKKLYWIARFLYHDMIK